MNLSTGVDLIEIERVHRAVDRYGDRFLEKIFTSREREQSRENPPDLAIRFAAKEAASKALGTGIGVVRWRDLEVISLPSGQPTLHLHGEARKLADQLGYQTWSVSLSHSREMAVAVVVGLGE